VTFIACWRYSAIGSDKLEKRGNSLPKHNRENDLGENAAKASTYHSVISAQ